MTLSVYHSCRKMSSGIFGSKLNNNFKNNFSVQRFENAFQRDLSPVKRYGSSGETAFFAAEMPALVNITQRFCN